MDIETIEKRYSELPTEKLLSLSKDADGLRPEVIPLMQKELLKRGEQEAALVLSDFLVSAHKSAKRLSPEQISDLVKERIASGEPLESIKLDLNDNGISIYEALENDQKAKTIVLDYITTLKEEGLNENQIDTKLSETFNIDEGQSAVLKSILKRKGNLNLVMGYTIVVLSAILGTVAIGSGGSVGFMFYILVGLGVWRIVEGHKQKK